MIKKLTYIDVVPYIEALKEMGRIAVLAMIPILIDGLASGQINWQLVLSAALIAVLRAVDKYAHLETKSGETDLISKVKLPF